MADTKVRLAISRDPRTGLLCISIGNTRVTPEKHTGSWITLKEWNVDADWLKEIIEAQKG